MFKAKLPATLSGAQKFEFDYKNLFDNVSVRIYLPDLSENECELSGDWGPHYKVALKKEQMIRVGYKAPKSNDYQWFMLCPSHLVIESPMLHVVRKETPYQLLVHDEVNNLRFEIFLDKEGRISNTKTTVGRYAPALRLMDRTVATALRDKVRPCSRA